MEIKLRWNNKSLHAQKESYPITPVPSSISTATTSMLLGVNLASCHFSELAPDMVVVTAMVENIIWEAKLSIVLFLLLLFKNVGVGNSVGKKTA